MFTVTQDNNFVRIFQIPQKFPSEFCMDGGIDITFKMVDWFRPLARAIFWTQESVVLTEPSSEKRTVISEYITGKSYFNPKFRYLAITDYGDSFIIQKSCPLQQASKEENNEK